MSTDLTSGFVQAVNGDDIAVDVWSGGAILNENALVIAFDIEADNGVIHVIDRVLIPPEDEEEEEPEQEQATSLFNQAQLFGSVGQTSGNILQVLGGLSSLSTLFFAVAQTDLVNALSTGGPFTLFAPSNSAFAALDGATLTALLNDKDALTNILLYHAVAGKVLSTDLASGTVEAVNGDDISVDAFPSGAILNDDSFVITTDIEATNGVIHIIDRVLLP